MTAGPYLLIDRVRAATADEYIVEGELGRGGMAAVFLGRDIALHRRVAIKVMLPDLVGVAGSEDRFVVEARTAAQLDHPGIVTIFAVKQRAGLTFIVMKYIEGWTLDRVLAVRGVLDPGVVATIGSQVAEALHFAHSQDVVHRDVKPSNIIIDTRGRPVVADFGIAKVTSAPSLTMAGATIGTPAYMSPEQCRGLPVTAASDQYSLGVVLYELLTGHPPFSGTLFELLKAHTSEAPPPILAVRPEVDPALEAIVTIMLAKNATERFPSLRDVSKALLSLEPRRGRPSDRQAIIAEIAADLEPPHAASTGAASVPAQEITPASPSVAPTEDATMPMVAEDASAVQSRAGAVESTLVAAEASPRPGQGKRVVVAVVAIALFAAVGYAIASRAAATKPTPQPSPPTQAARVDSTASTKPSDSVSTANPKTALSARPDTAPSAKPETTAKPPSVAVSKSIRQSTKSPSSKAPPKRDSVGQNRPDSIPARCAALNLKFSLGEEVTSADSSFLRRECAKTRPRPPGL